MILIFLLFINPMNLDVSGLKSVVLSEIGLLLDYLQKKIRLLNRNFLLNTLSNMGYKTHLLAISGETIDSRYHFEMYKGASCHPLM